MGLSMHPLKLRRQGSVEEYAAGFHRSLLHSVPSIWKDFYTALLPK